MRIILFFVQKEFLQVFRNKAMLPLLTVIPIVQLILLSYAATNEIKNINLVIEDHDHSSASRLLQSKLLASDLFALADYSQHADQSFGSLETDAADVVLTIPTHFERDFLRGQQVDLFIQVNSINGSKAGVSANYLGEVIKSFTKEWMGAAMPRLAVMNQANKINIQYSNWYNPELNYKHFMVPGILGVLVTIIVLILSAMNVVREREIGTIEQINVTPVKKYQFIIGKLFPFLVIGLVDLAIGLTAGKLIFDIPIVGSLWLVFGFCAVDLFCVLGIGLLISTTVDTQQQAMFVAWFFMMIFILMSGLFTPIESMPQWAQYFTIPNPIAHFVEVMRRVLLKGSTFADIQFQFWVLLGLGIVFNTLAVLSYRKQS